MYPNLFLKNSSSEGKISCTLFNSCYCNRFVIMWRVILFIYYPDLFSSSSDKNALDMPPVTTQPVQPETQLSDTIEQKDTIKEITPDVPKVVTPTPPVAQKKKLLLPKQNPRQLHSNPLHLLIWIQHLIKLQEPKQNIQSKKEKL